MNIENFCKYLGISKPTIYNWRREKPNLYEIVMKFKNNELNNLTNNNEKIVKLFDQLNEKEKEFYITDIKARILKKELDK